MKMGTLLTTSKNQSIVREYYEQLYANQLENSDETDKFLERHKQLKLTQEEMENLIDM